MRYQKNNRGSTLVLILIIAGIFAILATVIGSFAINENKQAIRQQKRVQAHYIARAGAEATAEWIMSMRSDEIQKLSNYMLSEKKVFGEGFFQVEVTKDGNNLIIKSTGSVTNEKDTMGVTKYVEEVVSLVLDKKSFDRTISQFDVAVFGKDSITSVRQGKGGIVGNIATNSERAAAVKLNGAYDEIGTALVPTCANKEAIVIGINNPKVTEYTDNKKSYPPPIMPDFSMIPISNYINSPVDTSKGDIVIRVKELVLSGGDNISVVGSNKLIILIDNEFSMNGNSSINLNGNPDKVQIYYNGSKGLDFKGNVKINASLYTDKASISLDGDHAITGDIITGGSNVTIKNKYYPENPRLIYAPNASVSIYNGNVVFEGAIIGKSVTVEKTVVRLSENSILNSRIPIVINEESDETTIFEKSYWK